MLFPTLRPTAAQAVSLSMSHPVTHPMSHTRKTASVTAFVPVTPRLLAVLGVVATVLFWGGLLVPYNGYAFMPAFVATLGGALALGGAMAVVLVVARQATVRLRSTELVAAVLHFSVVFALAALSFSAFLRG